MIVYTTTDFIILLFYICVPLSHVLAQTIANNHQSSDSWEGGYRRAEIERHKAVLKERKDELEARRKRIQTLRRAAKKGAPSMDNLLDGANNSSELAGLLSGSGGMLAGSGIAGISTSLGGQGGSGSGGGALTERDRDRDIMDNDMDLNTETEVIRNHLEQLKK